MSSLADGQSIGIGDTSTEQLATEIGLTDEEIAWRKDFLGFTDEDAERLESLREVVDAREDDLVDAFLDPIHEHDRTEEILDRSPRDEAALRRIVSGYFRMLTGGQYDREYFKHRTRIGSLHDRLDMPLHYFGGMFGNLINTVLDELATVTVESATADLPPDHRDAVADAIEEGFETAKSGVRGMNLDMQVVNDTYLHSYSQDLYEEIEASRELREEIADSIDEVQTEAANATKRMTQIDHLVDEQSEGTADLSGEIADLSATIEEIAATTDDVADTSEEAREAAATGDDAAAGAMAAMERVEAKQTDIGEDVEALVDAIDEVEGIVEVINDIANQTNILALNASIEAARAGEAGDGFAVVANEVKSLAEDTQEQASRVEDIIGEVTERIDDTADSLDEADEAIDHGAARVDETQAALESIVDSVESVATGIEEVAAATDEQAASSSELSNMVDDIAARADEVTDEVAEALESVRSQSRQITVIDDAVGDLGSTEAVDLTAVTDASRSGSAWATDGGPRADGGIPAALRDELPDGMPDAVLEGMDEATLRKIAQSGADRPF
ncbi:globin-coupled sensor protein [Haloplanus natans]|uniref:globin-coupled sensor protein n=1 Tax=Haloplanus natans TaxID=376171 RepID=UPI0009FE0873|nr:globin-coupled sensor protein [Haloplanus natans]